MSSVAFTKTSVTHSAGAQGMMTPARTNGGHASGGSSGTGKAPYRHIDDLVSVSVDLDPHTPLRKVLELGDAHMRQAMTYNDFRRPDLALQEYIKAFTIAVDKVPRHKDYPSMKSDPGHLNRLYNALKTKITTNGAVFDKVKEDIKEDNRRSGVEPAVSSKVSPELNRTTSSNTPSGTMLQAQINGSLDLRKNGFKDEPETSSRNGNTSDSGINARAGHKSKPPVQPKPQALHGKVINQISNASPEDLASRFARLRDSQKSGNPPKPPSVDTSMPAMPKLPEAIYSPARGTVTSEIANLPSSTPRGMFSRTNSITAPSVSTRTSTENAIMAFSREQFVTAQSYHTSQSSAKATQVRIPQGETISAATLANLINQGIEILIIDVRDRRSFDEGHIRSPRTICVDPEILMRENISADEIADSMVLAPPNEKLAIEQRDKVDLVVIYDQHSTSVPDRITGDSLEMVLHNLRQALSHYSYSRPLKNSPKLMRGGLASWLDEFGEISLETSDTASKHMPLSATSRNKSRGGGRYRTKTKTLTPDEVNQFEDIIQEDKTGISEFDYIKSRDDFIRRYPSVGAVPESMTTPVNAERRRREEEFLAGIAPAPPRRPAPAMPRTRYSGMDSRDDDSDVGTLAMLANPAASPGSLVQGPPTGLASGGNACYCNSTVQALLASPGFIDEILEPEWPDNWRGTFEREPTRPQLLSKILKNLLQWMHKRQFPTMRCTTLMHYMRSVHEGYMFGGNLVKLGDNEQHDVDEFTSFLFDQLGAETCDTVKFVLREIPTLPNNAHPIVATIVPSFWHSVTVMNKYTFVDRHFTSHQISERQCQHCHDIAYNADLAHTVYFTPSQFKASGGKRLQLMDMITQAWTENSDSLVCRKCEKNKIRIRVRLITLPRLFRVYMRRYSTAAREHKDTVQVEFPFNIDLGPLTWNKDVRSEAASVLGEDFHDEFVAPTEYELYAIQNHRGQSVVEGHYWTFVKAEQEGQWIEFNDDRVSIHSGATWQNRVRAMYNCKDGLTPVQLFYKRKDIPYEWEKKTL
ncbi:cysteine proteinase, partial [Annulohypoxylon bovei var. microspora]